MHVLQRRAALLFCALAVAGHANAQVVISQVYGGGGNSGATLRSDFIELHNIGSATVSLDGWSVQYASAAGSSWQVTPLAGNVPAGGYYLVKQADGSGGSVALPTPDATGTTAMSGTAGKVALSSTAAALSGACPTGNADLVGYGSNASCAEGNAPTPAPSNTLAVLRGGEGCTDTDNNAADFSTGAPAPRNSANGARLCSGGGQPIATLADVSQAEGNSGSRSVLFTLSLSQPAGAGGVRFTAATANGTAVAGSDYVALPATSVQIAAGERSATITVEVLGDTTPEPDETFALQISGLTGALPATLSATGTILNDDFSLLPIHAIQGKDARSPLEGQVVATSGIVTARRSAGFFLQAPDAETDGDPATSEGVYVYTGSAPPDTAAIGNRVRVQGTVIEYVPTADPTQPPLTEIGGSLTVLLDSTGNPLPMPVALSANFPNPNGAYDQLEALEGMRVTAASLTVNAPTGGNVNETNATATSNGVFHAVVTGVPRAFREPGVQLPDPLPAGSPAGVPRWNTNPEVIAVGSAGVGAERLDLASGCVVLDVTGPLDYSFRRYTLYPERTPQVYCNGADLPRPAPRPQADDVAVATYNMERFFDDQNDPAIGEPVLTPAAFQARLNKASLAIRNYLHTPDILGTVEVENISVLQTLAARINTDAVAAGQPDPQYVAYLQEGNDVGGIDVGFLVKTAEVASRVPRVEVVSIAQEGKTTTWTEPAGGVSLLNDRPPLVLTARVHQADGRVLPLTAIVVHQRSLNGAETDDAAGTRIRAKRQAQAEYLARLLQTRQQLDPAEQVLVMGDFNAFEFNDGYVDAMGTVTGRPAPDAQTVVSGDGVDLVDPDYTDLTWFNTPDQSYSYAFDGNVQSLDHIIANEALMRAPNIAALSVGHARINADFPGTARNDANTPTRLSDHDPTIVLLRMAPALRADLGVMVNAARAQVTEGERIDFSVDVENRGPDNAAFAAVALAFDVAVSPRVTAAPGWSCQPPETGTQTVVTCTIASLASGNAQRFAVQVEADAELAGRTLTLAASVASQTPDPQPDNNTDTAAVAVQPRLRSDLAVRLEGPATLPTTAFNATYRVFLDNRGNAPATGVNVRIEGNTVSALSLLVAPSGWRCTKQLQSLRSAIFMCSTATALQPGAQAAFQLTVAAKPIPVEGAVRVQASASSISPDANPADNAALIVTPIGGGAGRR
ncbi:lamin tail domain-containing protein [Xanthomonas hortorum]|uniref:Nuclease n=1 Tax=Xanthomonas hortorum pv. pelargonii TaxID=453602 RepID=A0A6V7BP76_9XANT|nr:lamin tail domain-containing protein [Xanthomonas hortorum]MCE4355148.1 lamin tail domain-containing protein [Xanthomonas hortorum pv. pelargonii]MCM5523353.1 lamin tail domain-containing protein [Xanthomonas hortorum pv. pelargonii]MCM5535989.1 lamin tail domain-containing protein [Xanthomonas hortorum pv. pelargonii]MCM5539990.1 lamin tail domain-containing protein [Xanthomonas hortorum pv. pelargonii]MCM5544950.1 lamin tail domain-containing protein [Xanthomonas hortorum pv. pelargonii]